MVRLFQLFLLLTSRQPHNMLWGVYQGLVLAAFTTALVGLLGKGSALPDGSARDIAYLLSEFVSFLLLFVRFVLGDDRYMKARYPWLGGEAKSARDQRSCCGEFVFLCFQTTLVLLLAEAIGHADRFIFWMTLVLPVNGAWLLWNVFRDEKAFEIRKGTGIEIIVRIPPVHQIGSRWSLNNFACLGLLLVVQVAEWHGLPGSVGFWVSIVLCLVNSVTDFALTRSIYLRRPLEAI